LKATEGELGREVLVVGKGAAGIVNSTEDFRVAVSGMADGSANGEECDTATDGGTEAEKAAGTVEERVVEERAADGLDLEFVETGRGERGVVTVVKPGPVVAMAG